MNTHSQREGIALIAVLGFLSILILMAIAFLMNMRTERLVAETAKDDVQTRQLLHGALAAAMDDVNDIDGNSRPDHWRPLESCQDPCNIRLPKSWVIMQLLSRGRHTPIWDANVRLISGEVTNWIPRRYLTRRTRISML